MEKARQLALVSIFFFLYLYDKFNLGVRREPSLLLFVSNSHTFADLAEIAASVTIFVSIG